MVEFIELTKAIDLIKEKLKPLKPVKMPIEKAVGRILAEDITAPYDFPMFNRSPLDGYALRAEDIASAGQDSPVCLTVVDTIYAGDTATTPVMKGQAVRIMTGAMMPSSANCVIKQEDTDLGEKAVLVYKRLEPFDNYCFRGEDFRAHSVILQAGTQINAAAVGILSSAGITENILVQGLPRVAILTTGNELVPPDTRPLPLGKIYSANGNMLMARIKELDCAYMCSLHTVSDDPKETASKIEWLLRHHDALITTGGVSVGAKDVMHEALSILGVELLFWHVNIKPGSPAMFSVFKDQPILSLSGNPFAAATTFELLGRPVFAVLGKNPFLEPRRKNAILTAAFSKSSSVRRFVGGVFQNGVVTPAVQSSPGLLSSFAGCNCLIDLPAGCGPVSQGNEVRVFMFSKEE